MAAGHSGTPNSRKARNQDKYRRLNPQDYPRGTDSRTNHYQDDDAQNYETDYQQGTRGDYPPTGQGDYSSQRPGYRQQVPPRAPRNSGGGGNNYHGGARPPQKPRPAKVRRKKRHHFLRNLFLLILLLLGLGVWQYFRGVSVAKKDLANENVPTETFNGAKAADGSTNILLIGSDQRPQANDASRADTIMILHLGKGQSKPKLLSIMRDTYVTIPGHDNNKINAAYAYGGAELLRQTIEANFGITLRYYIRVDFESFEQVIDQLYPKGVAIDAEKNLDLDGVTITAGQQKMTGHTLLQYARFRHDEEGDFGRIRRQQQVINALIQQAKNPMTLIHLPKAMGAAMTYTSTNLPKTFALGQGISYLFKGAKGVDRLSVPVENSWSYGNYASAGSVIEINFETNKQAITNFFAQ
ncbi:LCP family protein [Enterococcus nangangensis]|uniref:LCP family protein n=1 Tax=Enterococcus nangangensis TaxID=2559926 RepID=UPI0010F5FE24|nr:LCP family protein [Enterococcus nangangensis]